MNTLAEIQTAIEALPDPELDSLTAWLFERNKGKHLWPVPPPDVPKDEIRRIQARIDEAFGQEQSEPILDTSRLVIG